MANVPVLGINHSRRKNVARRQLAENRDLYPAMTCQRLRREEKRFTRLFDLTGDGEIDRMVAIWGVLYRLRNQILDIILYPRRPGSPVLKGPRDATRSDEILLARVAEPGSNGSNGLNSDHASAGTPQSAEV